EPDKAHRGAPVDWKAPPKMLVRSIGQPDAHSAVLPALVLDLEDLEPAGLLGGRHVCSAVGLHIQTDDVHNPHLGGFGWNPGLGPYDVGNGERLIAWQSANVDSPVRRY